MRWHGRGDPHDVLPCAELALRQARWLPPRKTGLEVLPVQGNVFMIAGSGGNTTVQIGPEAVVVVDTQTGSGQRRSCSPRSRS